MAVQKFDSVLNIAIERKGGRSQLDGLLPEVLSTEALAKIPDHRFLSEMTKCINQAGFSWKVIEKKWPQFEEAFLGFDLEKLALLSDEQWEAYTGDERVVRNWQKIKAVKDNLVFILDICHEYNSFAEFVANWPVDDQIGLMKILKKQGARLGGNTGQRFLRNMGKDAFILTMDVCAALRRAGIEIQETPTSQRDLKLIQQTFNQWHKESGLPYSHLSRIAACSVGDNIYH